MRSDGKLFATAGWDCRVRVYAVKSMRELAVLKWHKLGCYATAFAELEEGADAVLEPALSSSSHRDQDGRELQMQMESAAHRQRAKRQQSTHWLAAGSKDGKVSLWDIY